MSMTVVTELSVPKLAFPLQLGPDGAFKILQQDSQAEVEQCIAVLVGTQIGDRVLCPAYGIEDPTFSNPVPGPVIAAASVWEERAEVTMSVQAPPASQVIVTISVKLAASS